MQEKLLRRHFVSSPASCLKNNIEIQHLNQSRDPLSKWAFVTSFIFLLNFLVNKLHAYWDRPPPSFLNVRQTTQSSIYLSTSFRREAKFHRQKKWTKEADSVSYLQKKYRKLWTMPYRKQQKSHKVRVEITLMVRIREVSLKSCKISNITIEI